MRDLTRAEESQLASSLAEMARRRYIEDLPAHRDRKAAMTFSNDDIGKAIPREWYVEDIRISKAAKARIRAEARLLFGDYGKHGGARPGAGRKATGRTVTSKTVTLPDLLWAKLEAMRGNLSISRFLARKIQAMRAPKKTARKAG